MRNILMLTAALLGFAAAPAFAENMMSTTQSPPAANSSEAGVQSDNSLPQSADTSNYSRLAAALAVSRQHSRGLPSAARLSSRKCLG